MVQNIMSKAYISFNKSEGPMHSGYKINQKNKTCWKIMVCLTKINLITIKIIRRYSDYAVLSWVYMNYKPFLAVEKYDILLATQNMICF